MATYYVLLYTAISYDTNWIFPTQTGTDQVFDDPLKANEHYDDQLKTLSSIVATTGKAVKLELVRTEDKPEVQRSYVYDGENVRFWYAAYHQPGATEFEERYYIDLIYYDIGYYAFMHPKSNELQVMAIAQTREELIEILGENYSLYDGFDE